MAKAKGKPDVLGFGRARMTKKKLRLLGDQLEQGDAFFQDQLQKISNVLDAVLEEVSSFRARLVHEKRRFESLKTVLHSFVGKYSTKLIEEDVAPVQHAQLATARGEPLQTEEFVAEGTMKTGHRLSRKRKRVIQYEDNTDENTEIRGSRSSSSLSFLPLDGTPLRKRLRRSTTALEHQLKTPDRNTSPDHDTHHSYPSKWTPLSHFTDYPTFSGEDGHDVQCKSPPHPTGRKPTKDYSQIEYNSPNEQYVVTRDYRSTDWYKESEIEEKERDWRSRPRLATNLKNCTRTVDTSYEFLVGWEDFLLPYSGADLVITPRHPEYPSYLRGRRRQ
ncbi:hypothetical protein D9613_006530 [Agrocybe pediades]|uniref:Uncharacterized protein n=1 Tax=Agrocybe pediades TaxID=84607 RepID=A0A8H4QG87_9AGAR|nr:hypothetical protein D9613_006530 [Agrocybe pediades]